MGDFGIKISKAGIDVKTAANKDLLVTSGLASYKVSNSGSFSVTVPANSTATVDYTITHNLGYRAGSIITLEHKVGSASRRLATVFGVAGGAGDDIYSQEIKTTTTTVVRVFPLASNAASRTFNGYYYIFYDAEE